jgi:GTP-binding protein EngB required for normal cell division
MRYTKRTYSILQIPMREKTIVIFGNDGSGISSIINVIAREQLAKTSCDAHGCTSTPQRYQVEISGHRFVLFDTASLNQGAGGTVTTAKAEKQLGSLLRKLMNSKSDEIGLLVYCMRRTTAPPIVAEAYNKFYSAICQKKVPIVVVVTGLEKETHMESWWDTNRNKFEGMHFAGHACITAIQMYPGIPDDYTRRVAESSDVLRNLIVNHYPDLAVDDRRFEQIYSTTWTVTGMPINAEREVNRQVRRFDIWPIV